MFSGIHKEPFIARQLKMRIHILTLDTTSFIVEKGPYTLMAPTDHAFERLGTDLVNKLVAKPDLLASKNMS